MMEACVCGESDTAVALAELGANKNLTDKVKAQPFQHELLCHPN